MNASVETPVQPPELSDERLAQMRAHLLDEVDRDARKRERRMRLRSFATGRRRRMLVLVAAALGAIYAVPAVAQERWWWLTPNDARRQPATQVVTVGRWTTQQLLLRPGEGSGPTTRVAVGDERWIVQAFVSKQDRLCIGMSPDPARPANEGAFMSCGFAVHGLVSPGLHADELHWVGFVTAIPGKVTSSSPKFMFGPAAANVRTVDLENDVNGRAIRVWTHALPDEIGVDARFWMVVIPVDELVHTVVPRDEKGKALEHWRLPTAQ